MKKLGNYELGRCFGATELTMLYEARHIYLGKDLVIEASPAENDADLQSRLKFLARLLGNLRHPKILQIVDAFEDGKMMYLVFEWDKEIENLWMVLKKEKKLTVDRALNLFLEACNVIHYLHHNQVVHQNLQLINFLLAKNRFYLGGYTLANSLENPFAEDRRKLGDARYASPEWFLRDPICKEQDIWSLGVCLYYMLSGQFPFEGDEEKEVGEYVVEGKCTPLQELVPELPDAIATLVHRMLSREKSLRPDIGQIIEAVEGQLYLTPVASAFIAMPFHPQFNRVYQVIKKVCQNSRIKPVRVDENILPSNIWQDIEKGIGEAAFVIGDLSTVPGFGQSNPNVAFEVGIAYDLKKPTILLTQDVDKLPFDFKQQRAYVYQNDEEELQKLEKTLAEVIQAIMKTKHP